MLDTWSDRIGHGQISFGLRSRRRGRGGGPAPMVPASIIINSIGPQAEPGGNIPSSYTIDKNDAGVQAVLYLAALAAPGAADFGGGDPTYIDLGTVALDTSGSPIELAVPDELNGSYRLALLPTGGGDSDVAVSAPVTIDTRAPAPSDPLTSDAGKIYHFSYDDTARSGTAVTSLNDKGGNAFNLTGSGASGRPQQANASSPLVFNGAAILQTPTGDAANNLIQDHLVGGGAMRLFAVVDGATLGSGISILFSESQSNTSGQSLLFSISKDESDNVTVYMSATGAGSAFSANITTGVDAVATGLMIYEISVTQSGWQIWINGTSVGTGSVTPANFPSGGQFATLGGRASSSATSFPFTGDFYDLFVTGTTDSTALAEIRSHIATSRGITL